MFEVREVLRLWLRGEGFRSVERLAGVDRKTVRRYVTTAEELGLVRDGGEGQLGDVFIGSVVEAVRPHRSDGHGEAWRLLVARHDRIEAWLKQDGLTVVKVGELLCREGIVERTATANLNRHQAELTKTLMGQGRIHLPNHEQARAELLALEDKNGKVEHPTSGPVRTDDICDALFNVVWSLIGVRDVSSMFTTTQLRAATRPT